ncbi:MAG: hypothetical protein QXU32_13015 [Nitrososphaerales archaeon]
MDYSFEEIKPHAIQFRNKFQIIINSIKLVGKQLDEAKVSEDQVAQQFIPVINDAKNTMLSAIRKETSDQLHEIRTFEDVVALKDRAKGLLNRLGETGGSHSRTMHSFFGKHAKVLKLELGLLEKEIKRLDELIDRYVEKTSSLVDCKESITKISSATNTEKELVAKQKEILSEMQELRSAENKYVKKIEDFKNTEVYSSYLKSKEELAKMNNGINNLLSDVNAAFARISRPLSKYTYEVGLDKESNYLMQSIMENPVNLMRDVKIDSIIEVLNKLKEGIEKGRVVTKNPEKDLENITVLTANLNDYVRRYNELDSSARELRDRTFTVDTELEGMHKGLEQIRNDIRQKESYLNDYIQKINSARSIIDGELKNIVDRIERITNSRIKVVI